MSTAGDPGAAATRVLQPVGVVPVVTPKASALEALSGAGPNFTAAWGKTLPAGQTYEVQVGTRTFNSTTKKWSAPAYKTLSTGSATRKVVSAKAGTTYHLRARVRDVGGNKTSWGATSPVVVPYDDRAFTTKGSWTNTKKSGYFLGTMRQSKAAGASLTLSQYGSTFALVADRCSTCGKVKVYVDGKLLATVDTRASTTRLRQQVWSHTYSSLAKRTIKLVVVGTTGRPNVRIDGLIAKR
jgi:hypothetical protein